MMELVFFQDSVGSTDRTTADEAAAVAMPVTAVPGGLASLSEGASANWQQCKCGVHLYGKPYEEICRQTMAQVPLQYF